MLNYDSMIVRQRIWMLYLLAILVVGAIFTPYTSIFLGLLLGSTISFYNLYMLQRKIRDFTGNVAKGVKPKGLGTVSRFAAALLGVIIALRFEEHFNLIALIAGLMTYYLVIMLDIIVANIRDSVWKE